MARCREVFLSLSLYVLRAIVPADGERRRLSTWSVCRLSLEMARPDPSLDRSVRPKDLKNSGGDFG